MSNSAFQPTTTQVTNNVPTNVPIVTAWEAYTPATITGYTTSSASYEWRRSGDTIFIRGRFLTASTSATAASFTMPTGLTARNATVQTNGTWTRATTASSQIKTGHLYSTNGSNVINFSSGNFSTTDNPQGSFNGNGWGGSGEVIVFEAWAVVNEWSGSGTTTLATRAVEEYVFNTSTSTTTSDTTSFGYGPQGALIQNITNVGGVDRTVQFTTSILPTDVITVEILPPNASNSWILAGRWGGVDFGFANQNGVLYGIGIFGNNTSNNQVTVRFGQYAYNLSTYGAAGVAWSTTGGNYRWRVRKVSSGAQIGYPVSARNIIGDTSGSVVPTGMIGETLRSLVSSETNWPVASNVWGDFASLQLTAGTWLVNYTFHFSKFDATYANSNRIDFLGVGLSTTSGNSTTNLIYGINAAKFEGTLISGGSTGIPFHLSLIAICDGSNIILSGSSISGSTLRAKAMTNSVISGTPRYSLKLEATRIA